MEDSQSADDNLGPCSTTSILQQCWETIDKPASTLENLTVGPTEKERTSDEPWSMDCVSFHEAIRTFLSSGCCVVDRVLPVTFIDEVCAKMEKDLELIESNVATLKRHAIETENAELLKQASNVSFQEVTDRDGKRRDVRCELDRWPYNAPGLIYNGLIFPLLSQLLGENAGITLLYAGCMWALKSTEHQRLHADGGPLCDFVDLPPHCINVFIPLVDLDHSRGPTEFCPGSHRRQGTASVAPPLALTCKKGDAVLFDYRIQHRGLACQDSSRPVLYLAFAKSFFRDTVNTRSQLLLFEDSVRWRPRVLRGTAVKLNTGLENIDQQESSSARSGTVAEDGTGERWEILRMNVELPGQDEPTVLVVYTGDRSDEVARTFCQEHGLSKDFVGVLEQAIQNQLDMSIPDSTYTRKRLRHEHKSVGQDN